MMLDERMSEAVSNLRDDVDQLDQPRFSPRRSAMPAVLALIVLLGIGVVVGYAVMSRADESGGFSVATQPDTPDTASVDPEFKPDIEPTPADPTPSDESIVETAPAGDQATVLTGRITTAESGEFMMPIPAGTAWSNDETRLLMYRTGQASPGHFVVDAATGEEIAELPFAPADIEQVYWHPFDDDLLLYTRGAALLSYDLTTNESAQIHNFAGCDRVDSGLLPVAPAADGTVSLLCHGGGGREQVAFDLTNSQELRSPTSSDSAAHPSPSGRNLVRSNADGSATVLNRDLSETGVVLETENNLFGFLADGTGREWIATTLFDGSVVGSVVMLPLDGADAPVVVIGPDQGDSYPPAGTRISTAGNVVAISIKGADDGVLAGRLTWVELGESFDVLARSSVSHDSTGNHDYWSTPFLSLSPSGQFVVYSTDRGGDRVDTFVIDLGGPPG